MVVLPTVRLATFSIGILFAATLLGLNAHLTYFTRKYLGGYFQFAALSIATSCLTLVTLPVMIFVDIFRTGAITSMIAFELVWLCILWALWLGSAAQATQTNRLVFPGGCDFRGSAIEDQICKEFAAVVAFNFLSWFAFFAYTATVLVIAIIAKSRGFSAVWMASVAEISETPQAQDSYTEKGLQQPQSSLQPGFSEQPSRSETPVYDQNATTRAAAQTMYPPGLSPDSRRNQNSSVSSGPDPPP